jgi:hypothetical protein
MNYYKDAIDRRELDVPLEFEVWGKVIRDGDGNEVQVFVKKDKLRGLRKDSSFYLDGSWDVFEFDESANETRFKASSGISSLRKYDDRKRLTKRYMIDTNGDTLASEQYEWKNDKLFLMTANGVVRNYFYGKTVQETVRVIPSDEGFNYHSGYNGTAGKMPEEGTPEYEIFAMEPYGYVYFNNNENKISTDRFAFKSSALPILRKDNPYSCTNVNINEEPDMPEAQCIKLAQGEGTEHGYSNFDPHLLFVECKCNAFGKYQPSFTGETINEVLKVNISFWKYHLLENYWREYCRKDNDLQRTYYHEAQHIKNGRYKANNLAITALMITYDKKEDCEYEGYSEQSRLYRKWHEWAREERRHNNKYPPSPKDTRDRYDYPCN